MEGHRPLFILISPFSADLSCLSMLNLPLRARLSQYAKAFLVPLQTPVHGLSQIAFHGEP
jgi:hypothetical protein